MEGEWGCAVRKGACYPGADTYLMGVVPAGAVVPVHDSHLQWRAAEVLQSRRPRRLHSFSKLPRRCPMSPHLLAAGWSLAS